MRRSKKLNALMKYQDKSIEKWLSKMTPEERVAHDAETERICKIVKQSLDLAIAEWKQKAKCS